MTKTFLPVRDLCRIGIFAALTGILAQISIPLPLTPVPLTFAMIAVYLTGMLLHPKCAVLAQLCYLLIGAVGLPVFSGFRGGFAVLAGPTGGYLMAYPLMALIISFLLNGKGMRAVTGRREKTVLAVKISLTLLLSLGVLYLLGCVWMMIITGNPFSHVLALTVYPFVAMDIVKIVLSVAALLPLRERLIRMGITL